MIFELFQQADRFSNPRPIQAEMPPVPPLVQPVIDENNPMTPQQREALNNPPMVQISETPPHNNAMEMGELQRNKDFGAPQSPESWQTAPRGEFKDGGELGTNYVIIYEKPEHDTAYYKIVNAKSEEAAKELFHKERPACKISAISKEYELGGDVTKELGKNINFIVWTLLSSSGNVGKTKEEYEKMIGTINTLSPDQHAMITEDKGGYYLWVGKKTKNQKLAYVKPDKKAESKK